MDRTFDGAVARAVDNLPEQFRTAMLLVDAAGLSYTEAADLLGVPEGTVPSRLHRDRNASVMISPRRISHNEGDGCE